jgi:hypothetical protein
MRLCAPASWRAQLVHDVRAEWHPRHVGAQRVHALDETLRAIAAAAARDLRYSLATCSHW